MDRVVCSTIPSVRALAYARRHRPDPGDQQTLIVAMPETPGQTDLPHVPAEAAKVAGHRPSHILLSPATRAEVMAELPDCVIAHFACHGATDPADPSRSLLLLQDHDDAPLTVATLTSARLDHPRLAYLSACRTAFPAFALTNESVHLTSAFQLVSFSHVIGTLWEIDDMVALTIADAFYTALTDFSQTAHALRSAIRTVRDAHPSLPSLWAAHLHVGA